MRLSSSFGDGAVAGYQPSLAELLLGLGGMAIALLVVLAGCLLLRIMPVSKSARSAA